MQERPRWCVSLFRVAAFCATENPRNLWAIQWDQFQPQRLSEPFLQTGRGKTRFRRPASVCLCNNMILYLSILTIYKFMSGPSILKAFLQSKCRREMPSTTGSYQPVINKVFHLRQKQSLIRSQQQQQSSLLLKKNAVIISCPMSQRFLITVVGSSRLILLLLQWLEQKIHADQYIIVTCTEL